MLNSRPAGAPARVVPAGVRLALAVLLILIVCPASGHAQLAMLETAGLRIIYFDPTETFLVPHAARTFLNSLEFQRRVLGFDPPQPTTERQTAAPIPLDAPVTRTRRPLRSTLTLMTPP